MIREELETAAKEALSVQRAGDVAAVWEILLDKDVPVGDGRTYMAGLWVQATNWTNDNSWWVPLDDPHIRFPSRIVNAIRPVLGDGA